ncbi:ATPase, histidine kinase-, DNA gyrase B-, and HSP90-like domain protein protein [Carnobacterium maltaromaticum]|uniref:sensor histidine kinase n=1 Tax=Carnobacterium maltaromaticum TaxID=2751 RepID=UPI00191B9872|nr:sensor histidine kinase [Carnobacterium maltaromaticum]CAD5897350.1 ATPase, histidine kinase-, DNA gyrase B-, and HSP90-like domain protein protein [Carnobacterium maltaromaticum]
MNKRKDVNLTIDARIISHLGEALIDNEKVALLELIKNSSDADSNNCTITIDTYYQSEYGLGRIVVEDDGNGMNPFIIEKGFLKIATSFKKNNQKISPKFKRLAQGNKGIGRLALNQLGNHLTVCTKADTEIIMDYLNEKQLENSYGNLNRAELVQENSDIYYKFNINWKEYEDFGGRVEDIPIELNEHKYDKKIFSHKKDHGTKIEILGLKGISFWQNEQTARELETDVLAFLNPYLDKNSNFRVKIKLDNQIYRSDIYDKEYISLTSDSSFSFKFEAETGTFSYEIKRNKNYIKRKVDKLVKDMKDYDCDIVGTIEYQDFYSLFEKDFKSFSIEKKHDINKNLPQAKIDDLYTYTKVGDKSSQDEISSESVEKIYLPGDFNGRFYGYDFQAISREVKPTIESIIGVKLYRNNFRIFPYGDSNNDWLGMSAYNQRSTGVLFKTHTTTGFINIDGEKNLDVLTELTNRQGLVLNNYGSNFLLLVKELIYKSAAIEDAKLSDYFYFNRKNIRLLEGLESINVAGLEFVKKMNPREEAKKNIKNIESQVDKFVSEVKNPTLFVGDDINTLGNELKSRITDLNTGLSDIDKEFTNKEKQVADEFDYFNELLPVIGATIVSETLAHEIIRLSNNIKSYTSKIRTAIPNNNVDDMQKNLYKIDSDIKFLSRYASLMDVNSYSRRRRFEELNLLDELSYILKDSPLLSYKDITIDYKIIGEGFRAKIIRDSFKIIIENFLINSSYWLERLNIVEPCIFFEFETKKKQLTIFDNGQGISSNIENRIFEPFVTNKPFDEGRGMGLNIVKNLLSEIGAEILLEDEKNNYDNKYKFIINFTEVD